MKAVVVPEVGGPEVLQYRDVDPPALGPDEILVKTHTIGIGRHDVIIRSGRYPFPREYPLILGAEATGTVEEVGRNVDAVRVGQPVLIWKFSLGCYAEYIAVEPHEMTVLPDGVDLEGAVVLTSYQAAWAMLHDAADARRRRSACINGAAGAVGTAMIQLCALEGIPILAIASSEEKCAFAKLQGATATLNSSSEDLAQAVAEFTDGRGLDLMFDHLVGPDFREQLKLMGPLGQIITFNALGGLPSSDLFADLRKSLDRSVSVRAFSVHVYDAFPEERRRIADEVGALYAEGKIHPPISQRFPLAEAASSHRALESGHALGKIVLKP